MTAPQIVSFAWEAGHSKQVCYVGVDGEVHELSVAIGAIDWRHENISRSAQAPAHVGDNFACQLLGFAWDGNNSKHVFFADNLNHVHQLSGTPDGNWKHDDLTRSIPIYLMYLGCGYVWKADNSKHLVYPHATGAILEAHVGPVGRWSVRDLTVDAHILVPPRISSSFGSFVGGASFTGYNWSEMNSQQVAYIGIDGHIHELSTGANGVWSYADLTVIAGAERPSPNSFISGFEWEDGHSKQVVYFDITGAIHEISCGTRGPWRSLNITDRAAAPRVRSSVYHRLATFSWPEERAKQVIYVGDDRHIYELSRRVDTDWFFADLTLLTGAPNAHPNDDLISAHAWREGGGKQLVYVGADHHIYELFVSSGHDWGFADLTGRTSGVPVRV